MPWSTPSSLRRKEIADLEWHLYGSPNHGTLAAHQAKLAKKHYLRLGFLIGPTNQLILHQGNQGRRLELVRVEQLGIRGIEEGEDETETA